MQYVAEMIVNLKSNEFSGKGDSGGPLVCNVGQGNCLAGATSFGRVPCGQKNSPTVYANVADKGIYNFFSS